MNVAKNGIKDRQLNIEVYIQMGSDKYKGYEEVSYHSRITENNIIKYFQMEKVMKKDFPTAK